MAFRRPIKPPKPPAPDAVAQRKLREAWALLGTPALFTEAVADILRVYLEERSRLTLVRTTEEFLNELQQMPQMTGEQKLLGQFLKSVTSRNLPSSIPPGGMRRLQHRREAGAKPPRPAPAVVRHKLCPRKSADGYLHLCRSRLAVAALLLPLTVGSRAPPARRRPWCIPRCHWCGSCKKSHHKKPAACCGLRWLALIVFILALARPQWGEGKQRIRASGIDIVVSRTSDGMLAEIFSALKTPTAWM